MTVRVEQVRLTRAIEQGVVFDSDGIDQHITPNIFQARFHQALQEKTSIFPLPPSWAV